MSGHDRALSPFELEEPLPSRPKASGSSCPTTRYSRQDPEDGRLDRENLRPTASRCEVIEPAAHPVNPPHRLAVGRP